jgi:hypothetical protein
MSKSSVDKGFERLKRETGDKNWAYNSKTRGFDYVGSGEPKKLPEGAKLDAKTGKISLSRRQFDKNYGLLKAQGFKSFEEKAVENKRSGLYGFKKIPAFTNLKQREFKTREAMLDFLKDMPDGKYVFRVVLTGTPNNKDKYKQNDSGETSIYANQLAPMSASVLFAVYDPEKMESNLSSVTKWALIAQRTNAK